MTEGIYASGDWFIPDRESYRHFVSAVCEIRGLVSTHNNVAFVNRIVTALKEHYEDIAKIDLKSLFSKPILFKNLLSLRDEARSCVENNASDSRLLHAAIGFYLAAEKACADYVRQHLRQAGELGVILSDVSDEKMRLMEGALLDILIEVERDPRNISSIRLLKQKLRDNLRSNETALSMAVDTHRVLASTQLTRTRKQCWIAMAKDTLKDLHDAGEKFIVIYDGLFDGEKKLRLAQYIDRDRIHLRQETSFLAILKDPQSEFFDLMHGFDTGVGGYFRASVWDRVENEVLCQVPIQMDDLNNPNHLS